MSQALLTTLDETLQARDGSGLQNNDNAPQQDSNDRNNENSGNEGAGLSRRQETSRDATLGHETTAVSPRRPAPLAPESQLPYMSGQDANLFDRQRRPNTRNALLRRLDMAENMDDCEGATGGADNVSVLMTPDNFSMIQPRATSTRTDRPPSYEMTVRKK